MLCYLYLAAYKLFLPLFSGLELYSKIGTLNNISVPFQILFFLDRVGMKYRMDRNGGMECQVRVPFFI